MGSEMTQDVGLVMALTENGDRRINSQVRCLAVNLEVVYWQKVLVWYRHGCKILKCSTWTCKIQKKYAWHFVRTTSIFVHHGFLYVSRFFLLFETCNLWWSQLPSWRLKKVVKSIQIFLFPFTSHLRKQRWNMKMGDQKTDTQYSLPWSKPLLSMAFKPFYDWREMDFCDWAWYDLSMWWFQVFYVHPYLGKWSNLTNIFQMGGWNQLISYPLRQGVFDVSSMSIVPRRHQWHLRQRRQREGESWEIGAIWWYDTSLKDPFQQMKPHSLDTELIDFSTLLLGCVTGDLKGFSSKMSFPLKSRTNAVLKTYQYISNECIISER